MNTRQEEALQRRLFSFGTWWGQDFMTPRLQDSSSLVDPRNLFTSAHHSRKNDVSWVPKGFAFSPSNERRLK
jgi:hypothetical protein